MADKKKKTNRFEANHPPVDPNDPAILLTAGIVPATNAPERPQDEAQDPGAVTTPAEPEKPQEAPETTVSEPVSEPVAEPAAEEPTAAPVRNILEDLIPKGKKPVRGTYGFYLDEDVHAELLRLTKLSKAKNKSVFLNALLRRVLFDE